MLYWRKELLDYIGDMNLIRLNIDYIVDLDFDEDNKNGVMKSDITETV
jgi:hypothetical protein